MRATAMTLLGRCSIYKAHRVCLHSWGEFRAEGTSEVDLPGFEAPLKGHPGLEQLA